MNSPTAPLPMMSAELLLERMLGDEDICREVVELGLRDARKDAQVIEALRHDGNPEAARRALHSLRGSAVIFGADSFASLLQQMENDCENGRLADVLAVMDTFSRDQARYEAGLIALGESLRRGQ